VAWTEKAGRRWRGCYRDEADKKHHRTFDTKTDARNWARDQEAAIRGGTYIDPRAGGLSLGRYAESWLATYRQSAGRVDQVGRTLRRHILPTLGDVPMRALTPRMLQAWVNAMTDQGIAPTSVRNYASTLATILNAAVDDEVLAKSPYRKVQLPALDIDQRRFLDQDEADRLTQEIPDRYRALIVLALASGGRWGELVGLKRDRFNSLRGTITVLETLHELGGRFWFAPPKTRKSQRVIPLPRQATAALNDHIATYGIGSDGLIFTTPQGAPLGRANFRARVFAPACARAGIKGVRFHDLRHSHASWLLADGVPITAVSERLGHASVSMTLDCYSHVMPETQDVMLAVLDRRLAGGSQGANLPPSIALGDRTGS
jgi:integrase